jgi:hypothetical protein
MSEAAGIPGIRLENAAEVNDGVIAPLSMMVPSSSMP